MLVISSERMAMGLGSPRGRPRRADSAAARGGLGRSRRSGGRRAARRGRPAGLRRPAWRARRGRRWSARAAAVSASDLVRGERRGARDGGVGDALAAVVEPAELGRRRGELLDPAAPQQERDEVLDRCPTQRSEDAAPAVADPLVERAGPGWPGHADARSSPTIGRGRVELASATPRPCRHARPPRRRPRRSGARRMSRRAIGQLLRPARRPSCGQELLDEPALALARSSSRRRRGRPPAGPGRRPRHAARRGRAPSPPRSRPPRGRASARAPRVVAAMSASRVSWATFWARARMSFASRRASASVATRSASALSRSRRACSASLRPCSMRPCGRRASSRQRLEGERPDDGEEEEEVDGADDDTQNRLIWKSASAASPSAVRRTTSRPISDVTARKSTIRSPYR